jgi:hypothetical protein
VLHICITLLKCFAFSLSRHSLKKKHNFHLPCLCLALPESSTQATNAERGAAGPVKLCSVLPFALLEEGGIWCRFPFCRILNVFLQSHNCNTNALEYCSLATKTYPNVEAKKCAYYGRIFNVWEVLFCLN